MKLSDWDILYGVLFVCVAVPIGLKHYYFQQAQFTTEEYNRNLDRATWDCLMDTVEEEYEDGSIRLNGKAAEKHFYEQLFFVFDAVSAGEKEVLSSGVQMMKIVNQNQELTMEEADRIRSEMEQEANRKYEGDAKLFSFYFPYVKEEVWYQNLAEHGIYVFYDVPDRYGMDYDRYLFSGSRIKKSSR